MKTTDTMPLPERPGTIWIPEHHGSEIRCKNCGRDYNTHGAPEGIVASLNLPPDTPRHLICRWSDEAWLEYNRLRRRATVMDFITDVQNDLDKLGFTSKEMRLLRDALISYIDARS